MIFNEDQTVRSLEKGTHSGKNVCGVVPRTSSPLVHDLFSINLVRHTGFLQKHIILFAKLKESGIGSSIVGQYESEHIWFGNISVILH